MLAWVIGLAGSGCIAWAAHRKRSLSASGAAAAIAVGTLLYALGDAAWFGTLIVFFVTSSLWSKWRKDRKASLERDYAKTGRRDAGQVLANGGIAAALAVLHAAWPNELWFAAFLGVMATVNADTWATEIGSMSRRAPRHVLTWKRVSAGASGGVTALGTFAAACGAALIGLAAWLLGRIADGGAAAGPVALLAAATLGGLVGAFADSALGATLQRQYRCRHCGKQVERATHCGVPTEAARGAAWCTNDAVNALSSLAGGAAAVFTAMWIW